MPFHLNQRSVTLALGLLGVITTKSLAADDTADLQTADARSSEVAEVDPFELTDEQWSKLDRAVDSGLEYLATQQSPDGSFEGTETGQPAITSFCVMAYLSRGHLPGEGPYGEHITRAVNYVLSTQKEDGLLSSIPKDHQFWLVGSYNHAIAGLMLGEVYGMADAAQQKPIGEAIERALAFTLRLQQEPEKPEDDRGGWRYLSPAPPLGSDLSVTSWHLMFYRSARNAGFAVPEKAVGAAVDFVKRCYDSRVGSFSYGLRGYERNEFSRGMAGAGIVSLALAGQHKTEMARRAGDFLLQHPFNRVGRRGLTLRDLYYYSAYYCSQAMFQLGGRHYAEFYPVLLETLSEEQQDDGSWDCHVNVNEGVLGMSYSTSLAILSLTPPYQLLPVYQR